MFNGDHFRLRVIQRDGKERNSRVTLEATGKVVKEVEDRKGELDG